jgi:nucleoside-diphosphate-sugar epimerase
MARTVLITGAAGNIGAKLRAHFTALGWTLRLLDVANGGDPAVMECDLAVWDSSWAAQFTGVDAVVHLAGDPRPNAPWTSIQRANIDLIMNVYEAAARGGAKRLVFASSNWTMAGHRFETTPLTTDIEPYPVNPYGISKLIGERMGRSYSERWGLSVVCFRIGYNQRDLGNRPGAHMGWGAWGQQMWLSDRDLCQGFEKAILAPDTLKFAVVNLMSANPGMRWDLKATEQAIGYVPQDGAAVVETPEMPAHTESARQARRLAEAAERFIMTQRW